jgi:hypothetical protein
VTRLIAAALVVAYAVGCGGKHETSPPPRRAFYFWRTTLALTPAERQAVTDLGVSRIYVRAFDVAWNEDQRAALTVGILHGTAPAGVELVPVVYIRNDVFTHGVKPEALAKAIVMQVWGVESGVGFEAAELQLDCDWTDRTRDAFFALVRAVKQEWSVPVTSTIRLHQVKYRERTGVPPVERGTLMFYNMGKFSADPEARMIFDAVSAAKYLARIDEYPLPLDVALPIWSWTVHLRDEQVVGLMQSTDPAELPALDFLEADGPERFVATRSTFLHGTWLREGDVLKVEVTGPAETQAAAAMIAPHLRAGERTVTLFDLSERNLTRHGTDSLDHVFRTVR